jgi:hypothetical protein
LVLSCSRSGSSLANLDVVRYVPFIALCLIGLAVAIAGVLGLGVGAAYGGVMLAVLGVGIPYAQHLKREGPRAR